MIASATAMRMPGSTPTSSTPIVVVIDKRNSKRDTRRSVRSVATSIEADAGHDQDGCERGAGDVPNRTGQEQDHQRRSRRRPPAR